MRYSIFTLLMILGSVSLGQSKKEQIEILTNRVDSLNSVFGAERVLNQNKINELNSIVIKLEGQNADLLIDVAKISKELQYDKDVILKMQREIDENQEEISRLHAALKIKSDSLKIFSNQNNYLNKLPRGFKMTDPNGVEGERCYSDLDGDGINDLVILLFSEDESGGFITIFLSTKFYKRYEFEYFEWIWISNSMGEIICNNGIIEIHGGQTANDITVDEEVNLSFNNQQRKMVINFAERKTYELDKLIESERMDYIVLKTGVID